MKVWVDIAFLALTGPGSRVLGWVPVPAGPFRVLASGFGPGPGPGIGCANWEGIWGSRVARDEKNYSMKCANPTSQECYRN